MENTWTPSWRAARAEVPRPTTATITIIQDQWAVWCAARTTMRALGGVSYASAGNDSSSTLANIGSRLAFRGTIVKAASVAAYKALSEVS